MKIIIAAVTSKQGITSMISLFGGILIAAIGGKLFSGSTLSDVLVILGSITAIVGTQSFCTLYIAMRNKAEKEENDDGDD